MRLKSILILLISIITFENNAQESDIWKDFVKSKETGREAILPDFSYAGYQNSEVPIPKVNYKVFDVTNFGAIANDQNSDKEAIKKAIDAASKNKKGIVFFPTGKYLINTKSDDGSIININTSNIVLRGEEGTILFFDKDLPPADPAKLWTCPYAIKVSSLGKNEYLTAITDDTQRETFKITVADASKIKKGDWLIIEVKNNNKDLIKYDLQPLQPEPEWKSILNDGVEVNERHQVASVKGNIVTLVSPMHYDIKAKDGWKVYRFAHLSDIGFENITFEGNWTKEFEHHRSAQDDGGWSILDISDCVNSWVKDCTFKNISNPLSFNGSASCTALNILVEGKIGHASVHAAGGSTGILMANITDTAGMHHAVGVAGGSTTASVIWRSTYPSFTSFESHASQPRCTLFDKVEGGFFAGRGGGARFNLPNHGRYLVLWNFNETDDAEENFKFVATETWWWRIVPPIIVGFHGSGTTFKMDEVQLVESLGTPVNPESLFEAQLALRLGALPKWISEVKASTH